MQRLFYLLASHKTTLLFQRLTDSDNYRDSTAVGVELNFLFNFNPAFPDCNAS